jgi:Ca-activated chloride channel family protein
MNPDFKPSPEDRLIEELLHEQHHGPDEEFLRKIEAAVDGAPLVSNKKAAAGSWARYGIAAGVVLAVSAAVWWQNDQRKRERFAVLESSQPSPEVRQRLAAEEEMRNLTNSIRHQEDKVEEHRKVLSTIVRTKGITYKGADSFYNEGGVDSDQTAGIKESTRDNAIKRGLDAQDYVDAKDQFDAEHQRLIDLKMKQVELASSSGVEIPKMNEAPVAAPSAGIVDGGRNESPPMMKTPDVNAAQVDVSEVMDAIELPKSDQLAHNNAPAGTTQRKAASGGFGSGSGLGGAGSGAIGGNSAPSSRDVSLQRENRSRHLPSLRGRMMDRRHAETSGSDRYGSCFDQPWKTPNSDPLSTFSIDVDTASYGNVRRMIQEGRSIPSDAVRIEECVNAFAYSYQPPKGDAPFAVGASLATCPWNPEHQLVRVAIKGREVDAAKRPASNLVFLIDVSGSMQSRDKLPLLKQSMTTLVEQLDERDRVAIVVYAGSEGVALPSTRLDAEGRARVLQTLNNLSAGGSTNGGAGIKRAYQLAMDGKLDGGVNRVILATDGDFNVGVTGNEELVSLVKERAKSGVYLTVLGYGTGNLNDSMMDAITRDGNGNYFYIDSEREGRKVFLRNLAGTLVTIAKDVKIQVEFNPAKVGGYRLIGYANRVLKNEDFTNDKVDAGDIGAGHTVTAFYEITPKPMAGGTDALKYRASSKPAEPSNEWLTVKLRHKHPDGDESRGIEFALTGEARPFAESDRDFQFAGAVALFGMKLRGMEDAADVAWDQVRELAKPGLAEDADEDRAEFVKLLDRLAGSRPALVPAPAEVIQRR